MGTTKQNSKTIIIAGGGTGGHIYPGIAIAHALQNRDKDLQIHFVGTPEGLETSIVPRENFPLHLIRIGKLNYKGHLWAKFMTLLRLPWAAIRSVALLTDLKPQAVLGVGGYASGPFVLMSAMLGFRTALWEPNAHPGLTNRWLSKFVKRAFIVFPDSKKFLQSKHVFLTGMPIRKTIDEFTQKRVSSVADRFKVLVFGGSQGAKSINDVVVEMLASKILPPNRFEFVHQAGKADYERVKTAYQGLPHVQAFEFIFEMEKYYDWADLVICRSGASTVAEVAACNKQVIFIPLPWAADDHQLKNAQALKLAGAADLIEQKDLTPQRLAAEIQKKADRRAEDRLSTKIKTFHQAKAADKIAEILLKIEEYE